MVKVLLELARLATAFVVLLVGSFFDVKFREVPDAVWLTGFVIGFLIFAIEALAFNAKKTILNLTFSLLVTACLAFSIYYVGLFGGADAKALLTLGILLPGKPTFITWPCIPVYVLTIFVNALISTLAIPAILLLINLARLLSGEKLFEDLKVNIWRRILLMLTAVKVPPSKLWGKWFLYPVEEIEVKEGKVVRRVHILVKLKENPEEEVKRVKLVAEVASIKGVWATPCLPFILFLLAGYVLSLYRGDLLLLTLNMLGLV